MKKINKRQAFKLAAEGKKVLACPSKLSPYFMDGIFTVPLSSEQLDSKEQKNWVNHYLYYNGDECKGKLIHFYLKG